MTRETFTVTARRGARRWVLQCVEYPGAISEVARLSEAEETIREAISFVAGIDEESFDVDVVAHIADAAKEHVLAAQRLRAEAQDAQLKAAGEIRIAAKMLADQGLPVRDIGSLLEVSYQRAHQLVSDTRSYRVDVPHK